MPYVHGLSHGLKKIGNKYGVNVVFSAPAKLSKVCNMVSKRKEDTSESRQSECVVHHRNKYVTCEVGLVYQVPLTCGKSYIGERARCINMRLREHERSLSNAPALHLPAHCRQCGCEAVFEDATVLSKERKFIDRRIIEAFHIRRKGEGCISHPSIILTDKEYAYLFSTCT